MKPIIFGAIAAMTLSSAAQAAGRAESPLLGPVNQFLDAFNKGDMAGAAAAHMTDVVIVDEIAPHLWRGPKAFETWAKDLDAETKRNEKTEGAVTAGKTLRVVSSGSRGYVVIQVTYTYKEKGVPTREPAEMTFALQNSKAGWKIAAWSWDGTVPKAVPASPPPAK